MKEPEHDEQHSAPGSLEHTDTAESLRQLWWTIAATLVGLAAMAFFYY